MYVPLNILKHEVRGIYWALEAMRLPKQSEGDTVYGVPGVKDLELASGLVKAGDDHAKAIRGIVVWLKIELQVGFMIEFETYRHGVEVLSTNSSMHCELKHLKGVELAEQKQKDLVDKVYTRILTMSYQALHKIYHARRHHKHPDWQIFCDFIETLPLANKLITL